MLTSVFHKSSPLLPMGEVAKISWIRSILNSLEKEELLLCFLAVSLLTLPVFLVIMKGNVQYSWDTGLVLWDGFKLKFGWCFRGRGGQKELGTRPRTRSEDNFAAFLWIFYRSAQHRVTIEIL